jgi:hypothetical protein
MDRLDAEAVVKEMEGIAVDTLVYRIKGTGGQQDTTALSKGGIDECCTMLVTQGQCIREEHIAVDFIGEGEDREAIFTCKAARYAVDGATGRDIKLDQVLGVKREPLYEQRAPLTLGSKVPGKKWRHLTFADALEIDDAVSYLEWIRDGSTFDEPTKAFVRALLANERVDEFAAGKRYNPFWYEHGAMKAARNARSRLLPAGLKAQVIAMANQSGRVQDIERSEAPPTATRPQGNGQQGNGQPPRATATVVNYQNGKAMVFPYGAFRERGVTIDARYFLGATRVKKGANGAPDTTLDVSGQYVVSDERIAQAREWILGKLRKHQVLEDDGATSGEGWLTETDITRLVEWDDELRFEQERRIAERRQGDGQDDGPGDGPDGGPTGGAPPTDPAPEPPTTPTAPTPDGAAPAPAARPAGDRGTAKGKTRAKASEPASGAAEPKSAAGAAAAPLAPDEPSCPKCGSRMWDNRLSKRNPKAPDFKCRSRSCDGVIWPASRERSPGYGEGADERGGYPTDGDGLESLETADGLPLTDDIPF